MANITNDIPADGRCDTCGDCAWVITDEAFVLECDECCARAFDREAFDWFAFERPVRPVGRLA